MKNSSRWFGFAGKAVIRLAVLAGVFLLAVGIGAAAVLLYENGLPLSAGAAIRQQEAPTPGGEPNREPEKEPEATPASESEQGAVEEGSEQEEVGEGSEQEDARDVEAGGEGKPVGVWYSNADQRWTIFNQDLSQMPEGSVFEVYVFPPSDLAFLHQSTSENIFGESTYIDSPATNGNPQATLNVTQNWDSGGVGGVYNDHDIEARYDAEARNWNIVNEDGETMPEGALFNVGVFPLDEPTFVHESSAENVTENWTILDHPQTNGDPNAVLFVVQRQGTEG